MGLTSRTVVVVEEDAGRLVEVVEGRFGPAAAVDGALAVVVFLSEMEVVVVEDAGRLVGAAAEPPAAAALGRVLAAALGLVAPAAGCDVYGSDGGQNKEGRQRKEIK